MHIPKKYHNKHKWIKTGETTTKVVDRFLTLVMTEEICVYCGKKRNVEVQGAMRGGSVIMGNCVSL